jgi:hypothetical protein
MKEKVFEINQAIKKYSWVDIMVHEYKKERLVLGCSDNLTYGHSFQIIFEEVNFMQVKNEWRMGYTNKDICTLLEGEKSYNLNLTHGIVIGNYLFEFIDEDGLSHIIASASIHYEENDIYDRFQ